MRYVVLSPCEGGRNWRVSDESQINQYRDHYTVFEGTESEVHIIAWALNAVADGLILQAFHNFEDLAFALSYDGPTDGIAPPPAEVRA